MKIDVVNNKPSRFKSLYKFSDIIDEIEDYGMDEGRFFVHLKPKYRYAPNGYGQIKTMSFGNVLKAVKELKTVIKDEQ